MKTKLPEQIAERRRESVVNGSDGFDFSRSEYRHHISKLSDLFEEADLVLQELVWSRETFASKLDAFLIELSDLSEIERSASGLISKMLDDVESIRSIEAAARRLATTPAPDFNVVLAACSFIEREEILVVGSARVAAAGNLIRLLAMRFDRFLPKMGTSRDLLIAKRELIDARRESTVTAWAAVAASNAQYAMLTGPGGRIDSAFDEAGRIFVDFRFDVEKFRRRNRLGPGPNAA